MHFIDKCYPPVTDNVTSILGDGYTLNHWYVYRCNTVTSVTSILNFFLWWCGV